MTVRRTDTAAPTCHRKLLSLSRTSSRAARVSRGWLAGRERAMSGSNRRSSTKRGELGAAGDHHDLRVAVERPGVEVDGAEADDVVGDHDLRVDDGAREAPTPRRPPRAGRRTVPQRRRRLGVVRLLGDDDPHLSPRAWRPRAIRSTMSRSVRYGFITSRRSRAPSICSRMACEAATKPPGIT